MTERYDPWEQYEIARIFAGMLAQATGDGGRKRASGVKPPWDKDPEHEAGLFSHLSKWKHGELVDADSGAHPLVHAAWRCLAIAYQETSALPEAEEVHQSRDSDHG